NSAARSYLGLSYEGLSQFDSARAVYTDLLTSRIPGRLRRFVSGRLALLAREELRFAALQAIARESSLVRTPPDPNTVAVMPFRYSGTDTTYRPLERGLAAIVVTDLGRVSRLRLVERARVQALLDELKLAESGRVDPATGARSGRLVGAGEVVEGQFTTGPDQVRIDATVVRAADAGVAAAGSNTDRLRALFDVEKAVVFQLLDKLGITLTPAERVAISERPTRDLEAFLLYSRGLEAEDRGDFTTATEDYQRAARIDPAFRAAAQQAVVSQGAASAQAAPPPDVASAAPEVPAATTSTLLTAINGAVPTGAVVLQSVTTAATIVLPASDPNRLCEGAACDGPGRAALVGTVIIIIKRP
ncbi:MAG TPA: CsgG/HfaB family protein, partial [Gemmatimonadales bacterium]|nr:CsgG/HfaB family protein [Gemmatimonadales bacterium]